MTKGANPAENKQSGRRAGKINAAKTFSAMAKAYVEKSRHDGKAEAMVNKRLWFLGILETSLGDHISVGKAFTSIANSATSFGK